MRRKYVDALNDSIREYREQLSRGRIQAAYRGIMSFMSGLCRYLAGRHSDYSATALYCGYMDMTYFAFTPRFLKEKKLKLALVYLHEPGRFERWLSGSNKKIQAEYIELLQNSNLGEFKLSQPLPGVDSILELVLTEEPDFDHPEALRREIESKLLECTSQLRTLLT